MPQYDGVQYRLRAGSPMPTKNRGVFVVHSFRGFEENLTSTPCVFDLVQSSDFKGQAGSGGLTSASFTRLPLTSERYKKSVASDGGYPNEWTGGSFSSSTDAFMDCESVSIQYNNMGIATVNFTLVSQRKLTSSDIPDTVTFGGVTLAGVIYNVNTQPIAKTEGWYTTSVTLMATSN